MKLTNFRVQDATLEVAGVVLDLHNVLLLRRQDYHVEARRLVLTFAGSSLHPVSGVRQDNWLDAELVLTFEEVSFLRMQIEPMAEDTNACLLGFEPVEQRLRSGDAPEMVVVYDELFASDERADWTGWWMLTFIHGPDILIKAAEAQATISQRSRPY